MKLPLSHIAGLIGADGSFNISVIFKESAKYKYKQIEIRPVVNFRCVDTYRWVAESIQETLGAGKIYNHSGGVNFKMVTWQTVKKDESLKVAEVLIPHLTIKKDIAIEFADITKTWLDSKRKNYSISKREVSRPKEVIVQLARRAIDLNDCNQTRTNREKRLRTLAKIESYLSDTPDSN